VELANLQLSSRNTDGSLKFAEDAFKNYPNSAEVRLALIRGLLARKDFARADREIKALLVASPKDARAHVQAGVLAAAKSDVPAARASFDRAIGLDAASPEALAGHIALDLNAKNFESAKARIRQRLDTGVQSPEMLLLAARTYASAGDLQSAEQMLKRAIEQEPTFLSAYAMLGQLYVSQRKLDEARREYDALAQRHSRPVGALTMSGIISQVQGQLPLARQRFEQAVAADSHAAVAANNLAWIYVESGEKLGEAMKLAQTAAEALPESAEVLDTLGWVYYKNDLPALAISPLTRAVEKDPKHAVYHYHLGMAQAKAGNTPHAQRSLSRALELGSALPWAKDARAALSSLNTTPTP
jgi:tetratricopeptide (TPR) repeat protein